jgi:CO/xanthine dehydrogenase Mo-binding subunit
MAGKHPLSRREFVKGAGGLLIGFSVAEASAVPQLVLLPESGSGAPLPPSSLDAWLRIQKDGRVLVFTGKAEIGMGIETAFAQIVAEELDLPPARVTLVMGDTATTPDQGGVGGSTSIWEGARPLRNAAASARALLIRLASRRLSVAPEELVVENGVIRVASDRSKAVSYAELLSTTSLREELKISGQGFTLDVEGSGRPKEPTRYTVVGTSVPRVDLSAKVLGGFRYVTDVRVDGMLHARVVRPPGPGANLLGIDDTAARAVRGYVNTVTKRNFVGVVAETEWSAIRAAQVLKISWSPPLVALPDQEGLYEYMRSATPSASRETVTRGDVSAALDGAAARVTAKYEYPFHAHATMGPGCAVADVHLDKVTTVWCGAQKPHALQKGLAELLGVPPERVRVVWAADAGSYGRPGFEDAAADAVLLSQAAGRPVRVQWSRADMTAWGLKGPAVVCDPDAGLDARGDVTAFWFETRAFSGTEISPVPSRAGNFLASQLIGKPNASPGTEYAQWGLQTMAYTFPALLAAAHVLAPFHPPESPMRTTHLRDPGGPATTFAVESFIDELAAAAGTDPVLFRMKYLDDERAKGVLQAAADKAGWTSRASSPVQTRRTGSEEIASGRGVALGVRNGTYVCTVAEVDVNRRTGAVRVRRFVTAHDCGLIINPDALRATIIANLVQSLGRGMKEEVAFARERVTSVDWKTYNVARASDIPDHIDVVLLNRPTVAPTGAGEVTSRPTAAAIGNAIFDAVAVRVRRCPLTAARVKAALARSREV